jgi:hypothetical protein
MCPETARRPPLRLYVLYAQNPCTARSNPFCDLCAPASMRERTNVFSASSVWYKISYRGTRSHRVKQETTNLIERYNLPSNRPPYRSCSASSGVIDLIFSIFPSFSAEKRPYGSTAEGNVWERRERVIGPGERESESLEWVAFNLRYPNLCASEGIRRTE